jgi:hypothetical protein
MTCQRFLLTSKSGNEKTGPIAVSTTDRSSCPPTCPFKGDGGCYGEAGPLGINWARLDKGEQPNELTFGELLGRLRQEPAGKRFRHNQAGDLPGQGSRISAAKLRRLSAACSHLHAWTYTHKPLTDANVRAIRQAIDAGFCVNGSANNLAHADSIMAKGLPCAVVLPHDFEGKSTTTPDGRPVVRCPATYIEGFTCEKCGGAKGALCARSDRDFAIGLPAHGARARKASAVAKGE